MSAVEQHVADQPFVPLDADHDIDAVTAIESMCMNCHDNGETRLLITRIPYFRDVLISSFSCPHCGFANREVQSANEIAVNGCHYTLTVASKEDLDRQVIKSEFATIQLVDLQFEIPALGLKSEINTIEGIVSGAADLLQQDQPERMKIDPETTAKIQTVIDQLREFAQGDRLPFTLVLDDPSGNSFVENPQAPKKDPQATVKFYKRTPQQDKMVGITTDELENDRERKDDEEEKKSFDKAGSVIVSEEARARLDTYFDVTSQAAVLPGTCHNCHSQCETRMCVTVIPYFKEVVLMATQCENCGYKDTEVKPGGSVSALGKKITLRVESVDDLKRDMIKSDTAGLTIPELDLELDSGTLGGKYTTIEGILNDIKDALAKSHAFQLGDSSDEEKKRVYQSFMDRFDAVLRCESPFTFILDDPLANVFVHNPYFPKDDPNMKIEEYERSFEQNEDLGLNDINVDHYAAQQ